MATTYIQIPDGSGNERVLATYWTLVSATSGAVSFPLNSVLVPDAFPDLEDAVTSEVSSGKPTFNAATDGGGSRCIATVDVSGNFAIAPAPSAFPIALLYRLVVPLSEFDPLTQNVVEEDVQRVGGGGGAVDSVNGATGVVIIQGASLGTGAEVYASTSGTSIRFRSIVAGSNITVTESANEIEIASVASGNSYNPGGWN